MNLLLSTLFAFALLEGFCNAFTGIHNNGSSNTTYTILDLDSRSNAVVFQSQLELNSQLELSLLKQYYDFSNNTAYNLLYKTLTRNEQKHNIIYEMEMLNPPDVIGWYSGGEVTRKLIKNGKAHNLHHFFEKYGLYELIPQSMLQGVSNGDGHPFAVPTDMYHWAVHYDTRVFQRLGLTEPTTWDEFLHVCETLKADGIVPITIGTKYLWPLGGWMDYLNMRINGPEFHVKLCAGEVEFTDPKVLKVFEEWKVLIDHGYFSSFESASSNSWMKMVNDLSDGSAGMALMGDFLRWNMDSSTVANMSWFKFPEIVPGVPSGEDAPTDGYLIPENAINKDGAYAFLAHLMSTDIQKQRLASTTISANSKANAVIEDPLTLKAAEMLENADFILQFYDRDTDPNFASQGMQMMSNFHEKPSEYENLLKDLELKRQEFYLGIAPMPQIYPLGGVFTSSLTVNISTTLEGGKVFYTTDESVPTSDSLQYDGPIELATHGRFAVRAIVVKEGLKRSDIAQQVYVFDLKRQVSVHEAAANLGVYLSIFSMLFSTVLIALVYRNRRAPVVRATSPLFVIIMLIGVIIALATGIVSSIDTSLGYSIETVDKMCTLQVWTISVGWALAFGSLLSKTYRVILIFGNKSLTNKQVKNSQLLKIIFLMMLLEVAICLAWTVSSPLSYMRFEDDTRFWQHCYGENFATFMTISLLPKALMLLAAIFVSFKTRNYVAAFNESKTIGFAVYNLAFIGGSSFALSMIMSEMSIAHAVRVIGLNSTCLILASAIAVKPLYVVYFRPDLNTKKSWFVSSPSVQPSTSIIPGQQRSNTTSNNTLR